METPSFGRLMKAYIIDVWLIAIAIIACALLDGFLLLIAIPVFPSICILIEGLTGSSIGKHLSGLYVPAGSFGVLQIIVSYLIDSIVLFLMTIPLFYLIVIFPALFVNLDARQGFHILMGALLPAIWFLFFVPFYFGISEYFSGKTLGKKLMGLTVVQRVNLQ